MAGCVMAATAAMAIELTFDEVVVDPLMDMGGTGC